MRYRDPLNWAQKLGINFTKKDYWIFLTTLVLLLVLSFFAVANVSESNNYLFKPQLFYFRNYLGPDYPLLTVIGNYLYYIPETFNEEILIGAFLLMGLERNIKGLNKNVIVIVVALIFSLMHQLLYKCGPANYDISLTFYSILTLFFVGVLRNSLIIKTRKITYSWAIHLSFNLVFFLGFFINKSNGEFANEPERFNIVFGNLPMVILTCILGILSLIWLNSNRFEKVKQ